MTAKKVSDKGLARRRPALGKRWAWKGSGQDSRRTQLGKLERERLWGSLERDFTALIVSKWDTHPMFLDSCPCKSLRMTIGGGRQAQSIQDLNKVLTVFQMAETSDRCESAVCDSPKRLRRSLQRQRCCSVFGATEWGQGYDLLLIDRFTSHHCDGLPIMEGGGVTMDSANSH